MQGCRSLRKVLAWPLLSIVTATAAFGQAPELPATVVYKCPGNAYTSDKELNPRQAEERGCKVIEGMPVTVLQGPRPRTTAATGAAASTGPRASDTKVEPAAQRQRDADARRILESELKREEDKLASLKQECKGGEPDRQGNERNYQTYLDRVSALKASITRTESDIAAIRRELAKIGP